VIDGREARERNRRDSVAWRIAYEERGKPERAAAWKAEFGLADLPSDVFAPR
jgi:hypothetical protein